MAKATKYPRGPRVDVQVTREFIAEAKTRDSSHCMNAEALRAAFPEAKSVSVDMQTIRFSDPKKRLRYTYLTPRAAQVALVQFDRGVEVEPFAFRLRGAHVTSMGRATKAPDAELPERQKQTQAARQELLLRHQKLRSPPDGGTSLPTRAGGLTPPVMRDKNNIPISRRREYGLRAFIA